MARPRPGPRALKPNQQERTHRRTTIDTLLGRALRGALTIPEAALLADCVRAEQRQADATRQSLTDTTRALDRHRAAADIAIQEGEQRAESAEAAIVRVRALAERWRYTGDRKDTALPELLRALDQPAPAAVQTVDA
jgi:hypothetical protein